MELHLDPSLNNSFNLLQIDTSAVLGGLQTSHPELCANQLTNLISDAIMILNAKEQLVFANTNLLDMFEISSDSVLGAKPGEIFSCVHASSTPGGCGASEYCNDCGLRNSILLAKDAGKTKRECRIRMLGGRALDLDVQVESIPFGYENFTLLTLRDISGEKRRKALERTFFHDILNTAGVIHSASKLINGNASQNQKLMEMITRSSIQLIEEIKSHKLLIYAETGELTPHVENFRPRDKIADVVQDLEYHSLTKGKTLELDQNATSTRIESDSIIFGRVILNLIKNALEASIENDLVSVNCYDSSGGVTISIHNSSYIPLDVQHQIFQRSYSTKGEGRGIGTYSVKLFVEEYLQGRVWFESTRETGTVFYLYLPTDAG